MSSTTNLSCSLTFVEKYGMFEISSQTNTNSFLINTGRAYDGYGNSIIQSTRFSGTLTFPADAFTDNNGAYGYLCVRKKTTFIPFAYMTHPVTGIAYSTKHIFENEFYIATYVMPFKPSTEYWYYPQPDANGVINGIVLGKIYNNAVLAPNMSFRSPIIQAKDGVYAGLPGFDVF